jgi:hypothetical protein
MDDTKIQEGFARLETLIDKLANLCAHEFKVIAERFANVDQRFFAMDERFTAVDEKLVAIEGQIEAFGRRVDDEVEARHVIGERVTKLEKAA